MRGKTLSVCLHPIWWTYAWLDKTQGGSHNSTFISGIQYHIIAGTGDSTSAQFVYIQENPTLYKVAVSVFKSETQAG